jgi:hypothetical protein
MTAVMTVSSDNVVGSRTPDLVGFSVEGRRGEVEVEGERAGGTGAEVGAGAGSGGRGKANRTTA